MQRLEVSGDVRPIYGSLGVKRLIWLISKILLYDLRNPSCDTQIGKCVHCVTLLHSGEYKKSILVLLYTYKSFNFCRHLLQMSHPNGLIARAL